MSDQFYLCVLIHFHIFLHFLHYFQYPFSTVLSIINYQQHYSKYFSDYDFNYFAFHLSFIILQKLNMVITLQFQWNLLLDYVRVIKKTQAVIYFLIYIFLIYYLNLATKHYILNALKNCLIYLNFIVIIIHCLLSKVFY